MGELTNCPNCDGIFVASQFRDICPNCWKEEEKAYETVYQFIRKRENRTATMVQVVEATGVEEALILKFIKKGRLQLAHFPNLGYPCERCGKSIQKDKLCNPCAEVLRKELEDLKLEEERQREKERKEKSATYFTLDNRYKRN